jgi:hypothetical protein
VYAQLAEAPIHRIQLLSGEHGQESRRSTSRFGTNSDRYHQSNQQLKNATKADAEARRFFWEAKLHHRSLAKFGLLSGQRL